MSDQAKPTPTPDWMQPGARCTLSIEPAITMRSAAFDWDHEVQVALPASYHARPDRRYPVLWVTDGPFLLHLTVGLLNTLVVGGLAPEMIVVGVGCNSDAGMAEFGRRRAIDFTPPGRNILFDGPGGDYFRALGVPEDGQQQKADHFLDFLVDMVRPALERTYRMNGDHGLLGHSGGGMFASYALFARPGTFGRYIIGSPSSNAVDRSAFRLEADYAAANRDLKANVFFGMGEREIGKLSLAAWGIVSAPVLMAETLLLRQYPSLRLTTRIFPGKDHSSVIADVIGEGIRAVWADAPDGVKGGDA
ncbi:alpha/beta hydrolase-fold protein [Niveispirillum sp.]|uniref:alpha/beta hydrolase n=1 Tax=Niveispirillum sp. TaxID=1917217 RepID=UPI001B5B1956|nr:alpha/beta hydrolase-fold protein [Niveispirillum sp.]MBP7336730.1 alpha/beta hydrolase [Niveispirillum sp.]